MADQPKIVNPRHQAIRTLLAGMDGSQFAALKLSLEQSRAVIDARLAVLDAERTQLTTRKDQLDVLLERFGKPAALETFRTTLIKGDRLSVASARPKSEKPAPAKPKPAKRPRRTTTPRG